jgi:glutamate transport system substrate-binding protein
MTASVPRIAAAVAACALALSGCSSSSSSSSSSDGIDDSDVYVAASPTFDPGSTMSKLHDAGKIRVGVRFDQPGIGWKKPGANRPAGFDIEIAKIIAGELGLAPDRIQWVGTEARDRESYLRDGKVDLVVASYTMNEERRKVVGMAGPYYVTGQQLMVRTGTTGITGPKDVKGRKVCSAAGSAPLATIKDTYGADAVSQPTNGDCVNLLRKGSVDAVTTDGAILLGYVAQEPKKLKVVGKPFTTADYGIGYRKDDTAMCNFINSALEHAYYRGAWGNALFHTLWRTNRELPDPPLVQDCR